MSGHSKWATTKHRKGAQDAKRAAAFTKIAKEMYVAVKEGGGSTDPSYNSRLATVITKAKAANMPNDNIKRVLEKAAASGSGDNYETITYEGHGPCGVAVIVETMTDNRNRTAGSVRHHFDKYGGSLGTTGCVSWSFDRKGVIVIDNEDEELDEDTVMMDALDAGAADFQPEEGCFTVYTDPNDFNDVAKALEDKGYKFDSAQIEMVPQTYQKLDKQEDRVEVLKKVGEYYGVSFTDDQINTFRLMNSFGVPIAQMPEFLNMSSEQQDAILKNYGVPIDSTDNQFKVWVQQARKQNGKSLVIAIKADQDTPYPKIHEVMSSLQDLRENRYNLITSLKSVNTDEL